MSRARVRSEVKSNSVIGIPSAISCALSSVNLPCFLHIDNLRFYHSIYLSFTRYSQHGGKTFLYLFDHRSSVNPWPEWMGVLHSDELDFVFGMPLNASLGYTKNEVNMTKKFMKHWANFARTGYAKSVVQAIRGPSGHC